MKGLLSYRVDSILRSKDDMALPRRIASLLPSILVVSLISTSAALQAQQQHPSPFRAANYDVSASLDAAGASISATAKVEFESLEGSRTIQVELHPNLQVSSVKSADGKAVPFERDEQNPLLLRVTLPAPAPIGSRTRLTFTYGGVLSNQENSPVPGVRVASISKDNAYLLLPARWFPLTAYPTNRYTGIFRLEVPDTFAVAGTGRAEAPTPLAGAGAGVFVFLYAKTPPPGAVLFVDLHLNPPADQ